MKKLLLFFLITSLLSVTAYITPQGKKYISLIFSQSVLLYKKLFYKEIYPGQLILEMPESTGALPPEYYKRYTYTYQAEYDGTMYNEETSNFIIQKIIANHLAGGHNVIKLFTAPEAPGGVAFTLYKNVFDANGILIEKKSLGNYKIID